MIKRLIKTSERSRLLEGTPEAHKEEIGRAFDVLDEQGGLYRDLFGLRIAIGSMFIFTGFCYGLMIALIILATLHTDDLKYPKASVLALLIIVLWNWYRTIKATRERNQRFRERRREYDREMRELDQIVAPEILDKKFSLIVEWPIWTIHIAMTAWIIIVLLRLIGESRGLIQVGN